MWPCPSPGLVNCSYYYACKDTSKKDKAGMWLIAHGETVCKAWPIEGYAIAVPFDFNFGSTSRGKASLPTLTLDHPGQDFSPYVPTLKLG